MLARNVALPYGCCFKRGKVPLLTSGGFRRREDAMAATSPYPLSQEREKRRASRLLPDHAELPTKLPITRNYFYD